MYNFALKEIKEINGKIKIFKLILDGQCAYDDFEKEIIHEGSFISELRTIETRLYAMADCIRLPDNKIKTLKQNKSGIKEFEIKTHHLRVYLFHDKNTGRVIVCGGKKGTQKSDIKHFKKIKTEYFKQNQ